METIQTAMARQIAEAAIAFHEQRTGHTPESAAVVLSEDTLVITLRGALSPAEKVLAKSQVGAAKIQEFHRQLFAVSAEAFQREIERIIGMPVQEAAAEIGVVAVTAFHAFTTGIMVQIFQLDRLLSMETMNGAAPSAYFKSATTDKAVNTPSA